MKNVNNCYILEEFNDSVVSSFCFQGVAHDTLPLNRTSKSFADERPQATNGLFFFEKILTIVNK